MSTAAITTRATSVSAAVAAPGGGTERRRLALNFVLLSAGELVAKLLTFAAFAQLARTLQPERYGMLEFTLAVMVFFTLPVDLGLGSYGTREIARNPESAADLLREIMSLRLLLAGCSMAALLVFVALIHKSMELKLLLALYGVSLMGGPVLLQWFFQAHDQMHWVAIASIVRQLIFSALIFATVRPEMPLAYLGITEGVSVGAVGIYCLVVVKRRMHFAPPLPTLRLSALSRHIRECWPIGVTELAWAFMWYFATVLLGFLFQDESLGWFGASHRILMALHTFVWLYFFNLLPSISRSVHEPPEYLGRLMSQSLRITAWVGVIGAFGLTILSREVLITIYGQDFAGAVPAFAVLMWMLPVAMLSGHYRYILVAYNCQKRLLVCTSISAATAVVLGVSLVPLFGATGAAWALLLANILNLVLVFESVRRRIMPIPFLKQLTEAMGALTVAMGVFFVFVWVNVWVAAALSSAAYAGALALSQGPRALTLYKLVVKRA
jgi:O-antigen/teichoic acid export membrane protein